MKGYLLEELRWELFSYKLFADKEIEYRRFVPDEAQDPEKGKGCRAQDVPPSGSAESSRQTSTRWTRETVV